MSDLFQNQNSLACFSYYKPAYTHVFLVNNLIFFSFIFGPNIFTIDILWD